MKIAIIGGGASGLACAIECMRKAENNNTDVDVTVFEAKDRVGKKLLVTGNGRCNLMNENDKDCYFGDYGFASYALERYSLQNNLDFFSSMGLYTKADDEGRIYPLSNQASGVLDALRFECERLSVKFVCSKEITYIKKRDDFFDIGVAEKFNKVVLACGGKAGVKNFNGYEILKSLGHKLITPVPSLTKLTVKDKKYVKQLKGIRHKGILTLKKEVRYICEEKGELLFTDYGLSGIAVMQLSAYVTRSDLKDVSVFFDAAADFDSQEFQISLEKLISHNPSLKSENMLTGFMPKKLGECILKICNISTNEDICSLSSSDISKIVRTAKNLRFDIEGVRGFDDAQVTAGGADTKQFNPHTMESLRCRGLYCTGELLNVDGLCGGHNLRWAWSSGRLCGENLI